MNLNRLRPTRWMSYISDVAWPRLRIKVIELADIVGVHETYKKLQLPEPLISTMRKNKLRKCTFLTKNQASLP